MDDKIHIVGKVTHIGETQEVGNNGFKKRVVGIETAGEYPQHYGVEFTGDKGIVKPDNMKIGDEVDVTCSLRGRMYDRDDGTTSFFVSLNGFWVDKPGSQEQQPAAAVAGAVKQTDPFGEEPSGDDLPF